MRALEVRLACADDVPAIREVGRTTWSATYSFAGGDYVAEGLATARTDTPRCSANDSLLIRRDCRRASAYLAVQVEITCMRTRRRGSCHGLQQFRLARSITAAILRSQFREKADNLIEALIDGIEA